MAEKGDGTPDRPGTLSKFHIHSDGTRGWDTYTPEGEKVHITGTDISKDSPRNTGILTNVLMSLFGNKGEGDRGGGRVFLGGEARNFIPIFKIWKK